jgi:hypothetical protein
MMRRLTYAIPVIVLLLLLATFAQADECRSNHWQPTFVRHDSVVPPIYYYVEPAGGFTPVRSEQEALEACRARGVRNTIDGQNCLQREWRGFGCGCNITPAPNSTCARFQNFLRSGGIPQNNRTFQNPAVNGVRVDWCLFWARQCGKPAADEFCRRQGFTQSASFKVLNDQPPTFVIGSGQICREASCDGFSEIVCAGGSAPPR